MEAKKLNKPFICRTIPELRRYLAGKRQEKRSVGFVPTMGFLHEGHESLLRRSTKDNDITVLSIFVNPLQFGPHEDFVHYPRNEEHDLNIAQRNGVDLLFSPSGSEMYPQKQLTSVAVAELTAGLCGAKRPSHFEGVTTVVCKLFNLVQPDRAYFGQKDAQQVAVITKMVKDLNFPVEIVVCPIVRANDGLALSSRNVYLTAEQRQQACVLSQSLAQVPEWIAAGSNAPELELQLRKKLQQASCAKIDYIEILTFPGLNHLDGTQRLNQQKGPVLVALAVFFGRTRLIDNFLSSAETYRKKI